MPQPTDGLVRITLQSSIGGRGVENVFYYWDSFDNPITALAPIATQFDTTIVTPLSVILSTGVSFDNIRVQDVLGSLPDVDVTPGTGSGVRPGEVLSDFYAISFTLNVITKDTRKGAKRFAGVSEADVIGNAPTGAFLILMQVMQLSFAFSLITDQNYGAVVFGDINPNRLAVVVNGVTSGVANNRVTTQNSRKVL